MGGINMKGRQQQAGMSMLGMLVILIMVGFFVMCGVRMAPAYIEYLSVKDIVNRIVMDPETDGKSIASIRRRLDSIFNTNQIYELDAKSVKIYRKEGKLYIDAGYEVRVPVAGRIDAVMKFDDLLYVVGESEPVERTKATAPN
jgi:hypothetical protein